MGAWGTGPFENDDAVILVDTLMVPIQKVLRPLPRSALARWSRADDYRAARAAAQLIAFAAGSDPLGAPALGPVLRALLVIRRDEDWLNREWSDPLKAARVLDREIRMVKRKMVAVTKQGPIWDGIGRKRRRKPKRRLTRSRGSSA